MSVRGQSHALLEGSPRSFWNVPNSLTMSRLVLAIVVFALIAGANYGWALGVFLVACVTDALDGYFARLLKQDSAIGRQLDPLVDKVIVAGCYIYLVTLPDTGIHPWMVIAIVVRELLIQGLRSLLEGQGQPFGARMAGKLKTTAQCASICAVLVLLQRPASPQALFWVRDGLSYLAVALTIYSGIVYIVIAWPRLHGDP